MAGTGSEVISKALGVALSGKGAHVGVLKAVEGLDWALAGKRPDGVPHSAFQLLNHVVFWQEWMTRWLDGEDPPVPKHASGSWPGETAPANAEEWQQARLRLARVIKALTRACRSGDPLSKRGRKSRMEMIQTIALHTSYHIGQLVQVRQMLGAWPPPGGGVTW